MKPVLELIEKGGPVMIAILGLSVVLYAGCVKLMLSLRRSRLLMERQAPVRAHDVESIRAATEEINESYRRHRLALGAMITAAPLFGLLGTVSGMSNTFESLARRTDEKTMEGLARGISQVLVSTESGLVVALPALLVLYFAHREMRRIIEGSNDMDRRAFGDAKP